MIPKEILKNLGWDENLISALEHAKRVESPVSDVATSLKDLVIDGTNSHVSDVNVKSRPPVGTSSLRLQFEDR